jgi:hypothetical protein
MGINYHHLAKAGAITTFIFFIAEVITLGDLDFFTRVISVMFEIFYFFCVIVPLFYFGFRYKPSKNPTK